MRVAEILRVKGGDVEVIRPEAKVLVAVHRLRMQNVGALVVTRDGARVEGVLSERTRNRHVPVVDDGRLCGIVSIGDLVKHRLEEMELEASVLRDASLATH